MSLASPIALSVPVIGDRERDLVQQALASGFVSSAGPLIAEFEQRFAAAVGARHAVACASGTAALHLAFVVAGVAPGDLVMVSDFTFAASANAAKYQGADLLLVDSEPQTWCLDPDLVRAEFARRSRAGQQLPKVLEVVHILGQPAQQAALLDVCDEYGVLLIEDAAESLGASWTAGPLAGRQVGTTAHLGAFSFNGNKIITTGGGGMVTTDDGALADRIRHLSTQARVPAVGYLHDEVGFNYRLTNLAAALGIAQLERLDEHVRRKREIAARYDAALTPLGFTGPPRQPGTDSTYWLYSTLVPDDSSGRDSLLEHLNADAIEARALWRPLHTQPALPGAVLVGSGAVADMLFARGVSLPCSAGLSDPDQDRVIASIARWADRRVGQASSRRSLSS